MYRNIIILSVFLACLWQTGLSNETVKTPLRDIQFDTTNSGGSGDRPTGTFVDDEDLADGSGSGSGSGSGWMEKPTVDMTTPTKMTSTMASTTPRPLTQCQHERQTRKALLDNMIPRCTPAGDYEALQCKEEEGSNDCWCSDLEGSEVPGTRLEAPNIPDCHQGFNLPPCVFQLVQNIRHRRLGTFRPRCAVDGLFDRIQCHGSMCYCVDEEDGTKVPRTELHIPDTPNCDDIDDDSFDKISPGFDDKSTEEDKDSSEKDKATDLDFPILVNENKDDDSFDKISPGFDDKSNEEDKDSSEEDKATDLDFPILVDENIDDDSFDKISPGFDDKSTEEDKKDINPDDDKDTDIGYRGTIEVTRGNRKGHDDSDSEDKDDDSRDDDSDEEGDNRTGHHNEKIGRSGENKSQVVDSQILTQPGLLGGIIGGSVVILLGLVLLIMFIVYRMRKKDEGSYPLDEPRKVPNYNYVRAPDREYYA